MTKREMISCEEALQLVQEFLDGELEGVSESDVKRHFDVCERCYPHLKFESAYRDAVCRAVKGQVAPPELKATVAELIERVRAEE